MELTNLLGIVGSKQPVDFKTRFERVIKAQQGKLSEQEIEEFKKED
jgi:hypothetical protein